jgi:hypothetical protein
MDEEKVLNEEALDFLDEAMFTSSLISDKERQNGRVEDVDDIYPRTKAEAEYMDEMLNRAEQVAEDRNDEKYNERYCMLREIVDWSLKRHSTWKWSLICGALLGAGIFYYFKSDQEDSILRAKAEREQVEQWKTVKVAPTAYDKCPDQHANDAWTLRLSTAEKYKMYTLIDYKQRTESSLREVSEYKQKADTAKLEENKEKYLKQVKYYEESAAKNRAKYDSINAMDFAQVHEMAKADLARRVDSEVSHGNTLRNYMIYLLILIPLYIITGYPHGYSITRHRRRSGCMNIFQKIGFGIASFCFGTGLAMSLLPDYKVKTTYTDGSTSTHTESDPGNIIIIVLKVGLMIAGAFIFCFVSSVIMTVETAYGLFENFNWSGWFKKIKPAPKESATAMAQQNTEA